MSSNGTNVGSTTEVRWCNIESAEGIECDFEGEVEVFYDEWTETQWWDCPLCKHEHIFGYEEDYDDFQ